MPWMPKRCYVTLLNENDQWGYKAGVHNVFRIRAPSNFRSSDDALMHAIHAIRSECYQFSTTGWSKFRSHARLIEDEKAFCGAAVNGHPDLSAKEVPHCGRCEKILEGIEFSINWLENHPTTPLCAGRYVCDAGV